MPLERALGIQWNISSDILCFKVSLKQQPSTWQGILSVANSLYNPLFSSAYDPSSKEDKTRTLQRKPWMGLRFCLLSPKDGRLGQLENLNISRCYRPEDFVEIYRAQLHHFCGASEVGYGTANYLRLTNIRGLIHIAFVGKGRVAPLKPITIPRLELAAAVLAVQINRILEREFEFTLWPPVLATSLLDREHLCYKVHPQ